MEQVKKGLTVKDLLETALRWQACQCGDDDLRLAVRQALRQRLPDYQVEMLEDGAFPEKILEAIADDLAKNLTADGYNSGGFSLSELQASRNSRLPSQAILEVELLPEPQIVAPEDNISRLRMDPISLYHGLDGVIRFLTWDYLSLPGLLVVACVAAVASLPFVLENPEFSKDGSPLFPFGSSKTRPSQYSKQPTRNLPETGGPVDGSQDSKLAADERLVEFKPDTEPAVPALHSKADGTHTADKESPGTESTGMESTPDPANSDSPPATDDSLDQELDLDALLAPILAEQASDEPEEDTDSGKDESTESTGKAQAKEEQLTADDKTAQIEPALANRTANEELLASQTNPTAPPDIPSLSSMLTRNLNATGAEAEFDRSDAAVAGIEVDQRPVLSDISIPPQPDVSGLAMGIEGRTPGMTELDNDDVGLKTSTISPADILVLLEQGNLDTVLEIAPERFGQGSQRSDCELLLAEAGIRKGDYASKLQSWKILNATNTSPVADLLCARLLLGTKQSERQKFEVEITAPPPRGKRSRYLAWLHSWDANSNTSVRPQLQRFMLQYSDTACIDSIFMANAHFAKRDFDAAYLGLASASDRIQSLSLPTETAAQTWLLETSVRELQAKVQGSLRGLSSKLTKTAEIGKDPVSGQK